MNAFYSVYPWKKLTLLMINPVVGSHYPKKTGKQKIHAGDTGRYSALPLQL